MKTNAKILALTLSATCLFFAGKGIAGGLKPRPQDDNTIIVNNTGPEEAHVLAGEAHLRKVYARLKEGNFSNEAAKAISFADRRMPFSHLAANPSTRDERTGNLGIFKDLEDKDVIAYTDVYLYRNCVKFVRTKPTGYTLVLYKDGTIRRVTECEKRVGVPNEQGVSLFLYPGMPGYDKGQASPWCMDESKPD